MKVDVRIDTDKALLALTGYREALTERAVVRALNRTATTVRAVGAKAIQAALKPIKVGAVRKSIAILAARRGNLVAIVRAGGAKRIPLTAFNARQTKTGVTVKVGGRSYVIPHAFLKPVRGGRLGARIRAPAFNAQMLGAVNFRGRRAQRGGPDYPIAEIFAPGIPAYFVDAKILAAMKSVARERFGVVLAQEIAFLKSRGLNG